MKANEFIKKYGLDEARKFLEVPSYSIDQLMFLKSGVDVREIERLIESHELVEKMGGLECLKDMVLYGISEEDFKDQLRQAIADVESCQ